MANIAHIVFFLIIVDQCRNKVQGMFYIRRCSPGEHLLVSQPQDINDYAQQLNPSKYSSLWTVFNCRSGTRFIPAISGPSHNIDIRLGLKRQITIVKNL